MIILFVIAIALVFFILFYIFTIWLVAYLQTKEFSSCYEWGTFRRFKQEYDNVEWKLVDWFIFDFDVRSRVSKDSSSKLHAGVIKFNNKGMLLNPIAYIRAVNYVGRKTKECIGYTN